MSKKNNKSKLRFGLFLVLVIIVLAVGLIHLNWYFFDGQPDGWYRHKVKDWGEPQHGLSLGAILPRISFDPDQELPLKAVLRYDGRRPATFEPTIRITLRDDDGMLFPKVLNEEYHELSVLEMEPGFIQVISLDNLMFPSTEGDKTYEGVVDRGYYVARVVMEGVFRESGGGSMERFIQIVSAPVVFRITSPWDEFDY